MRVPPMPGFGQVAPKQQEYLKRMAVALTSVNETRYHATNNYFRSTGMRQFVDMPCGFVPRGLTLAREGIRYVGLDLPAVIDVMGPAVRRLANPSDDIAYMSIDATNYTSLSQALQGTSGELFVSTEGLFPYLTDTEAHQVIANVWRLLQSRGGCWVCTDFELSTWNRRITIESLERAEYDIDVNVLAQIAEGSMGSTMRSNFIEESTREEIANVLEQAGLDVQLVPLFDYLGDMKLLESLPEDRRDAVRDLYKDISFWVMTARERSTGETFSEESEDFRVSANYSGNQLFLHVSGRLDTLSSPKLIDLFQMASRRHRFEGITINMNNLEYISSAGLRALIIMYKALGSRDAFKVINANRDVHHVIEMTGFAEALGI
jgi:anti-anti-sigma factor